MTPSLAKLVGISTGSILPVQSVQLPDALGRCGLELQALLSSCNGFYAFEGALHLLPAHSAPLHMGLDRWNTPATWIEDYAGAAAGAYFFAEDVFGGQFCIADGGIGAFDPENRRERTARRDAGGLGQRRAGRL